MKEDTARKLQIVLLVAACIVLIVGLILTYASKLKTNHNPDKISVKLISTQSDSDDRNYYVHMSFEITNNTKKTLTNAFVRTYFYDKNGNELGNVTSSFGVGYGEYLKKGGKITEKVNIEESVNKTNVGSLFKELYENGLDNVKVKNVVVEATWADGYNYFGQY